MNQREHREQALARAQAATWALSEASQALIDARRASETAADFAHVAELDAVVQALWPIRERLQKVYNAMVAGEGFGVEIKAAIDGAKEPETP